MTPFMNVFLKNKTHIFDTPPEGLDEVNKGIRENGKWAALLLRGLSQNKGFRILSDSRADIQI